MRDIFPTLPRAHLPPGMFGRLILGLTLGLALLAVAARGVELKQVWAGLLRANSTWVILALLAVLLTTLAKIGRWRALFPKAQQPGLRRLGKALLVGQLTNALLPARVGDVIRAYLVGERGRGNRATALGTIAAEKVFDVLLLLICAGIAAFSGSLPPWLNISLAGLAVAGLLLFSLAVVLPQRQIMDWMERWTRCLSLRYPLDGKEPLPTAAGGIVIALPLASPLLNVLGGHFSTCLDKDSDCLDARFSLS